MLAWFSASKELIWLDIEEEEFQARLDKSKSPIGISVLVNMDLGGQNNPGCIQVCKLNRTGWVGFLVCELDRTGWIEASCSKKRDSPWRNWQIICSAN